LSVESQFYCITVATLGEEYDAGELSVLGLHQRTFEAN